MPGVSIKAARNEYDLMTASLVNQSFNSNYSLDKIAKVKGVSSDTDVAHNLGYVPRVLTMREIQSSPQKMAWGSSKVDDTNINLVLARHTTTYNPYASAFDSKVYGIVMVEDLENSGTFFKKDMGRRPVIKASEWNISEDANCEIHSGYDTFKVLTTGRLTIDAPVYAPTGGTAVETRTATYTHNLGYCPMYAPFIDYEIVKEDYYQWNGQFDNVGVWATSTDYVIGQTVFYPTITDSVYRCLQSHTSSNSNKPTVGTSYWEVDSVDMNDTYLNELEDIKYSFGGAEYYNYSAIKLYVTTTQIVLELTRYNQGSIPPIYTQTSQPAETVYVDYTLFYNPADEEFDYIEE